MTDRRAGKQAHQLSLLRITALRVAADMLGGQEKLADGLSIGVRALRAKLSAERGIAYSDLMIAARRLRGQADRVGTHAEKLEQLAEDGERKPPLNAGAEA